MLRYIYLVLRICYLCINQFYIMRRISLIFLTYFLIAIFCQTTNSHAQESSAISRSQVFGVRWRFGNSFRFDKLMPNASLYELRFNSLSPLSSSPILRMGNTSFSCSFQNFKHDDFTISSYVCHINQKPSSWTYRICIEGVNQIVLFQSKLRVSHNDNQKSILMVGDLWINLNIPLPCQVETILEDQSVSIVIIGSFFPAFNQQNYESILRKLEPLTSQVVTIPSYQIRNDFESFFYNLYFPYEEDNSVLQLTSTNTLLFVIPSQNQASLNPQLKVKLSKKEYFVIVATHETANSKDNSKFYEAIGMNILLSSQVSQEFSNRIICWRNQQSNDLKKCPLILHEGSLINNQMDYGVLTINNKHDISFNHYSLCQQSNHFELNLSGNQTSTNTTEQNNSAKVQKVFIAIEYIVIIVLTVFTIVTIIGIRKSRKPQVQGQNHIELVQQIVNQSQPNDPQT